MRWAYKQSNVIEVSNESKLNTNDKETYKKIVFVVKEVRVGEVLEEFQESFCKVKDVMDETVRVLQIDCAMAYQCEL